jgi:hypothetical protein
MAPGVGRETARIVAALGGAMTALPETPERGDAAEAALGARRDVVAGDGADADWGGGGCGTA